MSGLCSIRFTGVRTIMSNGHAYQTARSSPVAGAAFSYTDRRILLDRASTPIHPGQPPNLRGVYYVIQH